MAELVATDCQDLYELGLNATGVYYLPRHGRSVLCEMEGGDGGWMVMQRRAKVESQVRRAPERKRMKELFLSYSSPHPFSFLILILLTRLLISHCPLKVLLCPTLRYPSPCASQTHTYTPFFRLTST